VCSSDLIDLDAEQDVSMTDAVDSPKQTKKTKTGLKRKAASPAASGSMVCRLEDDLKKLRTEVDRRRVVDFMVFARHQEKLDQIDNERNQNKIILHGVRVENVFEAAKGPERDTLLRTAVTDILVGIVDMDAKEQNQPFTIKFIRHLNAHLERMKPPRQVLEVRLGSIEEADYFKKTFGALSKSWRANKATPPNFQGVGITGSVTKETRIRVEILKALAKVIKNNSRRQAFVLQHLTRPLLKVIEDGGSQEEKSRAFGFTEAISHVLAEYPGKLADQDLAEAYSKAGNKYGPEISHYFVVLKGRGYPINPQQ